MPERLSRYRAALSGQNQFALLGVLLIVILFFVTRWTLDGAYFRKDLVFITVPLENLYGQIQRSGQSPLWAPELAGGYPLLANGQLGFWYPPHMLLRHFLSGVVTLNVSLLLHALLGAVGTWLLLRHQRISPLAASVGALLLPLGATVVGKYESLNLILPFMWVPLLLWLAQLYLERGKPAYLVAWIGANAWAVLVGHPQMSLYVLCLEALATACLLARARDQWRRALALAAGAVIILGLTSLHLLPIIDNLPETDRAAGTLQPNEAGHFDNQFTPAAFLGLFLPHPFGHHETYRGPTNENELSCYIGPAALIVAGLGLFTTRRRFPSLWWMAVLFSAVGLTLALGGYSPVFTSLVNWGLHYFNAPARFFLYAHLGLVLLAAAGFDFLLSSLRRAPLGPVVIAAVWAAVVLPVLAVSWSWHDGVPWKVTGEPALAARLRQEPGVLRMVAGQKIADVSPDDDFGIKIWNPACATCAYRQTFMSPFASLDGVAIKVSNPTPGPGTVTLRLYNADGRQLREATLPASMMVDSDWNAFAFESLEDTLEQNFYFEIISDVARQHAPRLLIHTNPTEQYDPSGRLYNCTTRPCTPVNNTDVAFKLIVHSSAVTSYEALAPYVSAGFGIGSMQWLGALPLHPVKTYNTVIGTWGDAFGPGADTLIDRFATTHVAGLFPPHRTRSHMTGLSLVESFPHGNQFIRLYRNEEVFPRAHFPRTVRAIPESLDQVNTLLRLPAEDRDIVVANIPADREFDPAGNTVKIVNDTRTDVRLRTSQATEGLLVLRDVLAKGWVATVDGQPVELQRVDGIFRGVLVPAGAHTVLFRYEPVWLTGAVFLSSASLLVFACLVYYSVSRHRRTA